MLNNMKENDIVKMELLSLVCDDDDWTWDEDTQKMSSFVYDNNAEEYRMTLYWVDYDTNGDFWIYFQEIPLEGETVTGVGVCGRSILNDIEHHGA